ncbi:hypothetical protein G6F56_012631 [Rhizopus delemar]|nr:hypothetical protein G6F56_012631 [Rhizopus delemar]
MKAATRRKISYVVKSRNDEQAHCLGVNSLAIDASQSNVNETTAHGGLLYSAGRDGVVASWDLSLQFKKEFKKNGEESWSIDRQLQNSTEKTSCKAFSQMHTDWVNDIVLCEKGTCGNTKLFLHLLIGQLKSGSPTVTILKQLTQLEHIQIMQNA